MNEEFRDELKQIFKKHHLGHLCKVIDNDLTWAHGKVLFATTWTKKYIVYEKDGKVQSVKDNLKYYYQKGGA